MKTITIYVVFENKLYKITKEATSRKDVITHILNNIKFIDAITDEEAKLKKKSLNFIDIDEEDNNDEECNYIDENYARNYKLNNPLNYLTNIFGFKK